MNTDIQKAVDFLTNDLDVISNQELEMRREVLKQNLPQMKEIAETAMQQYRIGVKVYDFLRKETKKRLKENPSLALSSTGRTLL